MEKCFIQKFRGTIIGDNPLLGEMKVSVSDINTEASAQLKFTLFVMPDEVVTIQTPAPYPFTKGGVSMNSVELTSADSVVELEFYKANYEISIKNKYGIGTMITGTSQGRLSILGFDVESFAFKFMESISLPYANVEGDINDIIIATPSSLLVFVVPGNPLLVGDLKVFFDTLYNAGRQSGTINFDVRDTGVNTDSMPIVSGMSKTNGTITYSASGWTQTA